MLSTREHIELMANFEKQYKGSRFDREKDRAHWIRGHVYEDGHTNELFQAFRQGYALGRCVERLESR